MNNNRKNEKQNLTKSIAEELGDCVRKQVKLTPLNNDKVDSEKIDFNRNTVTSPMRIDIMFP